MGSSRTLLCRRGDPAGVDLCVNGSSHSIPRLSPHPEKRRWVHSYGPRRTWELRPRHLVLTVGAWRGKLSGPDAPWEGACPEAVSVAGELRGYRDLIFSLGFGRGLLYAVLVGGEWGARVRAQGQAQKGLSSAGQQWTARAGGWLSVFQEGQEAGLLSCPDFSLPLGQVEGKDVCLWVCPRGPRMRCEERLVCVGTSLGGTLARRFCARLSGWCRRPAGSPPLLPALFLYVAGLPLPFKVTDRWAQGHKVSLGPLLTPTLNSSFYLCAEYPANAVSSPGHSAGP